MKFDKLANLYLETVASSPESSHNGGMKNKEQYALKNKQTGGVSYIGRLMDSDPVEGQEGNLVDLDPETNEYSFYADGEGYTHPINGYDDNGEPNKEGNWEIIKVEPYDK